MTKSNRRSGAGRVGARVIRRRKIKGRPAGKKKVVRPEREPTKAQARPAPSTEDLHDRAPTYEPTSFSINPSEAWAVIQQSARAAEKDGRLFESRKRKQKYRVGQVLDSKIEIIRVDGKKSSWLGKHEVSAAFSRFNAGGGRIGARTLNYTVAKEQLIVDLHPGLEWSTDKQWIVLTGEHAMASTAGDAPDIVADAPISVTEMSAALEVEVDRFAAMSLAELRESIVEKPHGARVRTSIAQEVIYERDRYLVAFAKKRAGMRCEVPDCSHPLFHKPNGLPYLEVHHLVTLAAGGPDTPENVVCLCPAHHMEIHFGQASSSLTALLAKLRTTEDG